MFPLYDWYNLNGQLIRRKFCVLRKNQTSPRLRGDREANSKDHKNCQE